MYLGLVWSLEDLSSALPFSSAQGAFAQVVRTHIKWPFHSIHRHISPMHNRLSRHSVHSLVH
jgi:hypothetical protein